MSDIAVDLELLRLGRALGLYRELMLWYRARSVLRNGRFKACWLHEGDPVREAMVYRLLRLGDVGKGVSAFYRGHHGKWVYIRSESDVARRLTQALLDQGDAGLAILDFRPPGGRKVHVDPDAPASRIFALWLDRRGDAPIARATMAQAWGVTAKTTREWCRREGVKAHAQYALYRAEKEAVAGMVQLPLDCPSFRYDGRVARWQAPERVRVACALSLSRHTWQWT